jgi:molybdenum cofactor cytidylyltransferase
VSAPPGLHAIVLAAGTASRFGSQKLLAHWGDGVLLHGALAAAFAAPVQSIVVVTGADPERVENAALDFASDHGEWRLRLVRAAEFSEGMAASLRAGIAALPENATGAFVFLGDMPRVPHAVAGALAAALEGPGILAAAPVCEGRRGHPVLFARALFPALAAATGDSGGREVLQGLGEALRLVPVADAGVLFDVDRREDVGRA